MKENKPTGIDNSSKREYKELSNIHSTILSHRVETNTTFIPENIYTDNIDSIDSETNKEERIVSVFDVADAILQHFKCPISTMKLHKLLYYCQAWNLVWEEKPLFKEKIEAWANGPVVREVFNFHKGLYEISKRNFPLGNADLLSPNQKETIDSVLSFYGGKSAQWLIDQTHSEMPWLNARKGLTSNERGNIEISLDDMAEYYSSLK